MSSKKNSYLSNYKLIELKKIAKKMRLRGYSKMNKGDLLALLYEQDKEKIKKILEDNKPLKSKKTSHKNKNNSLIILQILISLGILSFAILGFCRGCKGDICANPIAEKFKNPEEYNIYILDFLEYSTCNSYAECETEFQKKINKINEYSHIPVNIKLLDCKSSDYNIISLEDAETFCKEYNADLVIYGGIEKGEDSLSVNINYATLPLTETMISNTKEETFFKIESIYDIYNKKTLFTLLEDIVNWNLGVYANMSNKKCGNDTLLMYLSRISDLNKENYMHSHVIKGIIYDCKGDDKNANAAFSKALMLDSTNYSAYLYRAINNVKLGNKSDALRDMNYSLWYSSECNEKVNKKSILCSSFKYDHAVATIIHEMPCSFTPKEISINEAGKVFLIQGISRDSSLNQYLGDYYCEWKSNSTDKYMEPIQDYADVQCP